MARFQFPVSLVFFIVSLICIGLAILITSEGPHQFLAFVCFGLALGAIPAYRKHGWIAVVGAVIIVLLLTIAYFGALLILIYGVAGHGVL